MRVRPEHRGHPAVEPGGERDLLARRLGMDVDDDHGRRLARLLDQPVDDLPHAVRGIEEERPEKIDDRDGGAVAGLDDREPAAGRRALEVRGADDRRRRREVGADLLAPPRVVAERERVRARGEEPFGEPRRDPDAVRDVLAVDDAGVDVEALAQAGQQRLDRVAAGATHDVADEQQPHG